MEFYNDTLSWDDAAEVVVGEGETVSGIDFSLDRAGVITGTVVQNDAAMPYWALLVLYNNVHNQPPLTTDNKKAKVSAEPDVVYTSVNYADKSNLKYFLEANKLYQP